MKSHSVFYKWMCLLTLLCLSSNLFGDSFEGEVKARKVASAFFNKKCKTVKRNTSDLHLYKTVGNSFLFGPEQGPGFVWVVEGDNEPLICGYSMTTEAKEVDIPVSLAQSMNIQSVNTIATNVKTEPIAPLLTSVWDQVAPYNGMCPYYKYDDGRVSKTRCKVGCVATATSEVMRYYEWPKVLKDTLHGWTTNHYELSDVLPGVEIDWDNILDTYSNGYTDQEAQAVQELALYCGMACKMNYGINSSGSNTFKMMEPLQKVFDYKYVTLYDRAYYSPNKWRDLLQFELRRGVPLIYVGYNIGFTGHAFVVDGLDDSGFYHIRWGEGGTFNGYFNIDFMNAYEPCSKPTEMGKEMGHFSNQSVIAIHPDSLCYFEGDTLTYETEDIEVHDFKFLRSLNTNGYVTAEMDILNKSADTITYTVLAFTTHDKEEINWEEAEGVGITTVTLFPKSTTKSRIHCRFESAGTYQFGLTADQEHVLYFDEVNVAKGNPYALTFGPVDILELDANHATFVVPLANALEGDTTSDIITYCFSPKGDEKYESQWSLFTISANETQKHTITFTGLVPDTDYTLLVRYPWTVVASMDIRTPEGSCVEENLLVQTHGKYQIFNLQGVCIGSVYKDALDERLKALSHGIYLLINPNGKIEKFIKK